MSIKMADGVSIKVSKIGKWFLFGFALSTFLINFRHIGGFVYSLV